MLDFLAPSPRERAHLCGSGKKSRRDFLRAGVLGAAGAILVGMSPGGAAVLGAMVGSASYIAAPAAVRLALPQASPGIYLTLSLAITFPFNLVVGIPLFLKFSRWFSGYLT